MNGIKHFVVDYCMRHANPVNAVLHIIGVPTVFVGVYLLFCHQPVLGWSLFVLGYLLQYLGHKAQGNEVGEVTLIKKVWHVLLKNQFPNNTG
jgi:uncharacterized membrane protein YGL010W